MSNLLLLNEPWVQTSTGKRLTPFKPKLKDIDIIDIAIGLSRLPRFSGQGSENYSVGQHSVLVSELCEKRWGTVVAKYGLLHDGSEGLAMGDLSRTIKHSPEFESYRKVENILQLAIYRKFGLAAIEPSEVKIADDILLSTEAFSFMKPLLFEHELKQKPLPVILVAWAPPKAKQMFLQRFHQLFNQKL